MIIYHIPNTVRKQFITPFEQYKDKNRQSFEIVKQLPDSEGESMFRIKFQDGTEIDAWGHEIQEHETYCLCGCQ